MPEAFYGGLYKVLVFLYDSSGRATGTQSSLSNGSTSGAYVIDMPRAATFNYEGDVSLTQQGGDKLGNTLSFASGKIAPFEVSIDEVDTTLQTLIEATTANTANTYFTIIGSNTNKTAPRLAGVAITRRGITASGAESYQTVIMPKCQLRFRLPGGTFRGEGLTVMGVTPMFGTVAHTGQSFGSAGLALDLEEDKTDHYTIYSDYPIHIVTQKSDGVATTFNTIYKPISTTITVNASPNMMHKNGTATALSSITLAGVATLAAAGTAGDVHVLTHQTAFVPV